MHRHHTICSSSFNFKILKIPDSPTARPPLELLDERTTDCNFPQIASLSPRIVNQSENNRIEWFPISHNKMRRKRKTDRGFTSIRSFCRLLSNLSMATAISCNCFSSLTLSSWKGGIRP